MKKVIDQIVILKDFIDAPGARSLEDGDYSGEDFLNKLLKPKFENVLRDEDGQLFIDLDNTEGYATSFLEAAFGGLARIYSSQIVLERLVFKSDDEPMLIEEIKQYINEANEK